MRSSALVVMLASAVVPATAQCQNTFSGDWVCAYGCRETDANPRVEVEGNAARCWNELGGVFFGALLSADSLSCFHKIGTLSRDGNTIEWSDGVVWKRHFGSAD
jgi:hypothetical protein